ncbi:MAG: DeoR/GlpR transcriptional regulator [Clostridiales bacterium]|nr:DeoR/GlpR transcriptional regulator [Clostridiales bacterium]
MAQKERLEQIMQIMRIDGKAVVTDLSSQFGVTPETIRRDLEKLEKNQKLTRTHGGAVLKESGDSEKISFLKREKTNVEEKRKIAQLAAKLVPVNASIGCDASSTALELLYALKERSDILVLTNSAKAICEMEHSKFELLSSGGYVNRQSYSFQGGTARNMIQEYHLEQVFMGCRGIGRDGGIFDSHELEIEMKKALLEQGSRIILLADHTKFGSVGFTKLGDIRQMDIVITDRRPSDEWMALFEENHVELLYEEN